MTFLLLFLSCSELTNKYATDDDGDNFTEFEGDCDDANRYIHPEAIEKCDGIDNDCDSIIDQDSEDARLWYPDIDEDGYGLTEQEIRACEPPANHIEQWGDCNDSDPLINQGATEICDEAGVDENCNDIVNEPEVGGVASVGVQVFYPDDDNDGYGNGDTAIPLCFLLPLYADNAEDCNDEDSTINPEGIEVCDEEDNNCDGIVDEDFTEDGITYYLDADGDGFGDPSEETQLVSCLEEAPEGYVAVELATDCDDSNASYHPGATEYCNNADEDCDGTNDDWDSDNAATYYLDADNDGYGAPGATTTACSTPEGYALSDEDCDDSLDTININTTAVLSSS